MSYSYDLRCADKETFEVLTQMLRDYDHGNLNKMLKDYADGNLSSVIRCKDCAYGVQEELFDIDGVNHRSAEWHCMKDDKAVVDDWYCAGGERKNE